MYQQHMLNIKHVLFLFFYHFNLKSIYASSGSTTNRISLFLLAWIIFSVITATLVLAFISEIVYELEN